MNNSNVNIYWSAQHRVWVLEIQTANGWTYHSNHYSKAAAQQTANQL